MRLHPVSALFRALQYGVNGFSIVFFLGLVLSSAGAGSVAVAFAAAALGGAVGVGYGVLQYYRFEYDLTADTLDVASGVLSRREREIPLGRVQNVDVSSDVLQRLFGVAVVRVETAGGGSTEAELSVVSTVEADRLRREIRERRAGIAAERDEREVAATADRDERPDDTRDPGTGRRMEPLFELSPAELAVLALSRFRAGSLLVLVFAIPFADVLARKVLLSLARPLGGPDALDPAAWTLDQAYVLALVAVPLTLLGSLVVSAVASVAEYYDFQLGRTGGDLVYERGMFRRYSGSIPVDKVQSITVTESWLLRPLGYAGLTVETAGYDRQRARGGAQSAVPVSDRERVETLAHDLFAFEPPAFERPPVRARRRYAVRYALVVAALLGLGYTVSLARPDFTLWYLPAVLLPLVPVAAHCKWANLGYHVGEDHVVVRAGFWRRRTQVVPYYRLQTVVRERTVFQRRLGLASLVADTASSATLVRAAPAAVDVDAATAATLQRTLRDRLQGHLRPAAQA